MELLFLIGLLVTAAVLALALRRAALSWHDHLVLKVHPANVEFEHLNLRSRIGNVDRWGRTLTIAVFAYGIALVLFAGYQLFDEAIRKLEQLIRLL